MSDKSFVRIGGLAGILLALSAWAAVGLYFALVPAAQQLPVSDANAYLASLVQNSTGTLLFNGLYALIALWSLIATVAVYYHLRRIGEAWAFFALVVGAFNAAATIVASLQQLAQLRYVIGLYATAPDAAAIALGQPAPLNPFNLMTAGLTSIWFLVTALLILRSELPKLLGYLGLVAFADLAVGFIASLAGVPLVAVIAAGIAGAVGGPVFWLWLGVLLRRDAARVSEPHSMAYSAA
ncbi:MAG TPA: DUF4386 family protein [Anaerolineae bacterium]|nr:DUF4386 family protein [Anaerolineae bacterium]